MNWKVFWQGIIGTVTAAIVLSILAAGGGVYNDTQALTVAVPALEVRVEQLESLKVDVEVIKNDVKWIREALDK